MKLTVASLGKRQQSSGAACHGCGWNCQVTPQKPKVARSESDWGQTFSRLRRMRAISFSFFRCAESKPHQNHARPPAAEALEPRSWSRCTSATTHIAVFVATCYACGRERVKPGRSATNLSISVSKQTPIDSNISLQCH